MSRAGESIRKMREEAHLTPKALAKKLGLAETVILEMEGGRRVVSEEVIKRVSKILGKKEEDMGLASLESTVSVQEKQRRFQKRAAAAPKGQKPSAPPVKNDVWDQAFGSNLKNLPIHSVKEPGKVNGSQLYPVQSGKIMGINQEKAVLYQMAGNELAAYGIFQGSLLLGQEVKEIVHDGYYLMTYNGENLVRKVQLLGNGNARLLRNDGRELSSTVALKELTVKVRFHRVETKLD